MSKYLVAGGAGFIGTNLVDKLLEENHEVLIIDNFCTGSMVNVDYLQNKYQKTINVLPLDISKPEFINQFKSSTICSDGFEPDYVINLACPASPPKYQRLPVSTILTCSIGVHNLLTLSVMYKSNFFHASTSEVYGDPLVHPQVETYRGNVNCYGPRACYDEGKRLAEALCYEYSRLVPGWIPRIRVGRLFNTYGPHMDPADGRIISNFITQALTGKEITIHGMGTQTRSPCYVTETVDAILKLVRYIGEYGELSHPVNIGNPEEYTVKEIADKVLTLTNSPSKIIHLPLPEDDPLVRRPDISAIKNFIEWNPVISLDNGLSRTIDYFRGILNG